MYEELMWKIKIKSVWNIPQVYAACGAELPLKIVRICLSI